MGSEFSAFVWDDDVVEKRLKLFESESDSDLENIGERERLAKTREAGFT